MDKHLMPSVFAAEAQDHSGTFLGHRHIPVVTKLESFLEELEDLRTRVGRKQSEYKRLSKAAIPSLKPGDYALANKVLNTLDEAALLLNVNLEDVFKGCGLKGSFTENKRQVRFKKGVIPWADQVQALGVVIDETQARLNLLLGKIEVDRTRIADVHDLRETDGLETVTHD